MRYSAKRILNLSLLLYYSDERISAGDEGVQSAFKLPPNTATHLTTSDFQTELFSKLLLTGTHLRTGRSRALVLTSSTLHPQIIYAIAFSAGLNGLQVTKLIAKTINELLLTLLAACPTRVQ